MAAAFIKDNYFMVFTVYTVQSVALLSAAVLLLLLMSLS